MEQLIRKKRTRVDPDASEFNLPEVKRLREDLLDDLDDSEFCTATQDFDSFMKSFEEEITASSAPPAAATATEVVDLTADSDVSQPEFGYLLEASDDELGLPPPAASEIELISNELWELEERFPNYDSFELGIADLVDYNNANNVCEYVALDELFDHSDLTFGSPDFLWRPETLPAKYNL